VGLCLIGITAWIENNKNTSADNNVISGAAISTSQISPSVQSMETPLPQTSATGQSPTIDISDPLGSDVLEFATIVMFDDEPKGSIQKIAGIWTSQWNRQGGPFYKGTATVLVYSGNWITIVYQGDDGGQYLLKAKLIDNKLVGRYANINVKSDTTPWVGIIVDDNRIDGKWTGGEWNFTRSP
jgi:hypothetical protein